MKHIPNIAVCDDTPAVHQQIQTLLTRYTQRHPQEAFHFYAFSNQEALLKNTKPLDLLFLDVEIGDESGIALVPIMQKRFPDLIIMFISSHTKYFVYSHRLNVFQFLTKPFEERIFLEELDRFYSKYHDRHIPYTIDFKNQFIQFPATEIVYIEASQRYIRIYHSKTGFHEKIGQIGKEESKLKAYGFLRCHHGYLVNARYIQQIKDHKLYLQVADTDVQFEIPISKNKLTQVKQQYQQWLLQQEV